ncbi:MAG TPA: ABC transporter ATP-binding protein [Thermoanaerobaculia bacterium]|nr:ABC transporter ATP-binding protein [Thermoanaerobaculia bacterium]
MIRLIGLSRRYRQGKGEALALDAVELDVADGEFVSITGPSGAGKSTLLSILGLLDDDWSGEYWLDEEPVHSLRGKQRRELAREKVGFVFQAYHLLDDLTVAENVELPLSYRKLPRRDRQEMVADVLERFGMAERRDLRPPQLSGGQQQLVAVARAVVGRPQLVLADEPTGNLHSRQGERVMEVFRRLNGEGATILQATHHERFAEYAGRVIELEDGRVVADRPGREP